MGLKTRIGGALLLAVALAPFSMMMTGCPEGDVRVYDSYHHDYHDWGHERVYYDRWERDTHRNHEDFRHRSEADRKDYWDWRHSHPDEH